VVARQSRCSLVSYCESRLATPYLIRHLHNLVGVCCTSDVLLLLDYSTTGSQPSTGFFGLVIFWLGKGNFGIPTRYLLGSHAVGRLQACLRLPCALRSRWLPPAAPGTLSPVHHLPSPVTHYSSFHPTKPSSSPDSFVASRINLGPLFPLSSLHLSRPSPATPAFGHHPGHSRSSRPPWSLQPKSHWHWPQGSELRSSLCVCRKHGERRGPSLYEKEPPTSRRASPFVGQLQPNATAAAKHTSHHWHIAWPPPPSQAHGRKCLVHTDYTASRVHPTRRKSRTAHVVCVEIASVTAAKANHRRIANSYPPRPESLTGRCSFRLSM
jgi:hypothetical protein